MSTPLLPTHLANHAAFNCTAGVIAPGDSSDGCHLNPGGAVRLGVRVASDIHRLSG